MRYLLLTFLSLTFVFPAFAKEIELTGAGLGKPDGIPALSVLYSTFAFKSETELINDNGMGGKILKEKFEMWIQGLDQEVPDEFHKIYAEKMRG